MISRRLLRIKVLKILYAYVKAGSQSQIVAEKELAFSIKKTYDLYCYIFILLTELADFAQNRIDIGMQKHLPTEEEKKPNTKFVDNELIKLIEENKAIKNYINQEKLSWAEHTEFIKKLYNKVVETEYYKNYMANGERSFKEDKALVCSILENEIEDFEDIYTLLEDKNIYWVNDLEFVLSMAIKTLKKFKANQSEHSELMTIYKDETDKNFCVRLLRRTINDYSKNEQIIDEYTKNWDLERVAFMDILILQMIIAEACEFPEIPINVTIDEYIEISKHFSSPTSSGFINGVADKILNKLIADKVIVKQGLGLVNKKNT